MEGFTGCRIYILLVITFFLSVPAAQSHGAEKGDAAVREYGPGCAVCCQEKPVPVYNGPQAGGYFLIRFFQIFISPQNGPSCRHTPVCSTYGREAVKKYGLFFGSIMAGDRLLRCNPYRKPMNDPVPEDLSDVGSPVRSGR